MKLKETEELLEIWSDNDRLEWSDEAFEAIRVILLERLGEVPPQAAAKSTPKQRKVVNEKGKLPFTISLMIAAFLIAIVLLNPPNEQKPLTIVQATSTALPIIEITSFPTTLKLNDIDLELSGYQVDKDFLTVTICFSPPTKEIWLFDDIYFSIQQRVIAESWTSTKTDTGRADGFSCGTIAYPVDLIPSTGQAKLFIERLKTPDEGDCNKAQQNLDEAKTGIVIRCDPNINNGLGFVIVKKPVFMKDGEAIFKAREAFSDIFQVDWRFKFVVEKP